MITLIRLIILLALSIFEEGVHHKDLTHSYVSMETVKTTERDSTQTKAYEILAHKCNSCHEKRNRRRVFTESNMMDWSDDVYKQVFVKKRMPKGKNNKLTSKEYQDLLTWITSTKQYKNGNQL